MLLVRLQYTSYSEFCLNVHIHVGIREIVKNLIFDAYRKRYIHKKKRCIEVINLQGNIAKPHAKFRPETTNVR